MSNVTPYGATDKHAAVQTMFGRIAGRYDLMNRLMTGGLDGAWRRTTVAAAALPPGGDALDVGTGTGDLAIEWARSDPTARVVGIDYTGPMLALAPAKADRARLAERTTFARAGGRVVALEICPPRSAFWRLAFGLYFNRVVPIIGRLVSGDGGAYRYLPASAAAFPTPDGIAGIMRAAGLTPLPARVLMAGALAVHIGVKSVG